jgi:hypothetical protein
MPEHYKDVSGGWYKEHDYTLRVGAVDPGGPGQPYWATIVLITRYSSVAQSGWPEVRGWPGGEFFGDTEDEAFHAADRVAKAWIDSQDDARWSG